MNASENKKIAGCQKCLNCVSSEAQDTKHAIDPFCLKKDQESGWNEIRYIISNLPRSTIVNATNHYLHAECKSRLFGFIDDLELQLDPVTGYIGVRSASRTGCYDFGVNRRRVSSLRQKLVEKGIIF
jgi:uncharacterized protein (DUF1499 family)